MSAITHPRQDSSAAIDVGAFEDNYRTDRSEGPAGAIMTSLPAIASTPVRPFSKKLTTSHTNLYAQPKPIVLFDSKTTSTEDFEDTQESSVVKDTSAPAVFTPSIDPVLVGPYKTSFPQDPGPSPPNQWMTDSPCASSCAHLNKSKINNNESTVGRILFLDSILEEAQSVTADLNHFGSTNSVAPNSISSPTQGSSITIKLDHDSQGDSDIGLEDSADRPMEDERTVPQLLETLANCRSYDDTSFLTDSTLSPLPSTPSARGQAKARISQASEPITSMFDFMGKSNKAETFFQSSASTEFTSTYGIASKDGDTIGASRDGSTINLVTGISQRDLSLGESPCSFSGPSDNMACISIPVFRPGIDTENVLISGTGMVSSSSLTRNLELTTVRPSSIPEETPNLDDPLTSLVSGSRSPQQPSLDMSVAVPTNVSTPDPPSRPSIPTRPRNRTVLRTSTSGSHRARLQPIAPGLTRHPLGDINANVSANGVPAPTVPRPTRQRHIRTSSRDKSENRNSSVPGNTQVRPGTDRVNTTSQVRRHILAVSVRMHTPLHTTMTRMPGRP